MQSAIRIGQIGGLEAPDIFLSGISDNRSLIGVFFGRHGDDGGHLDIVSIDYQVRTSEAKLKTTVHK